MALAIDEGKISLTQLVQFLSVDSSQIEITSAALKKVENGYHNMLAALEKKIPIYGVSTGFGDSCFRVIQPRQAVELQKNLISYLKCGTGPVIPKKAAKAAFVIRLNSLSKGLSGVSPALIERMCLYLNHDWVPVIPRHGSLGASGDLVPLAYIAAALTGEGYFYSDKGQTSVVEILKENKIEPYILEPKEGLALVNGTSAMAGVCVDNLKHTKNILLLANISTSWLCLALRGRRESFADLVNKKANLHSGQQSVANAISNLLDEENYSTVSLSDIELKNQQTTQFIQDRYSLRCAPQILGPAHETVQLAERWLEEEINGVSDNPLFDDNGVIGMGGNFYGGYLSQAMDYLKISLAQVADLYDRQMTYLMDEKSNRGLPPNLANWPGLPEEERFLHHGLKGLHQSTSAMTSEILAKSGPNSIFSRSTESHNQDKVSLGMSAAMQCSDLFDSLYDIQSMHLIGLAQALDLRAIELKGQVSRKLYESIREIVPFVSRDRSLDDSIVALSQKLKNQVWGHFQ